LKHAHLAAVVTLVVVGSAAAVADAARAAHAAGAAAGMAEPDSLGGLTVVRSVETTRTHFGNKKYRDRWYDLKIYTFAPKNCRYCYFFCKNWIIGILFFLRKVPFL
jgi:hypothetical protein